MRSLNFILLCFTLSALTAWGQAKNSFPDLKIIPKTTVTRPAGQEGQFFSDKTTHKFYYYNGSNWLDALLSSSIVDTAYDATSWNGVTTDAPSKNAVRDILETMIANISTAGTTVTVADDTTTNSNLYPVWTTATGANVSLKVTIGRWSFNPSTGLMSVTSISAPGGITSTLTGNASTATALAADPADCAANTYATTISAAGVLTCSTVSNAGLAGSIAASKLLGTDIDTLGTVTTGTWSATAIGPTKGGTGLTSYTLGDTLYASAANTLAKLAGNITTSLKVMTQTGDGVNSAAPVWVVGTSTNTASSIMARDASGDFVSRNATLNAVNVGYRTTATAAGTTTLTVADTEQQFFSGVTTQTVVLPVVTTLINGSKYRIVNLSTGIVTVQSSGANTIQAMVGQTELVVTVRDSTAGTGTTSWTARYSPLTGGGGGGGSAVRWYANPGTAPTENTVSGTGIQAWGFVAAFAGTEVLDAHIKVPNSYQTGNPIKIKAAHYSSNTSNTILIKATCYLITKDSSAINSTTNSRVTTNAALTNAVTSLKYREGDLDCSDSTGKINSVAVGAGDIIHAVIYRGTDTDTGTLFFVPEATEVTFQ